MQKECRIIVRGGGDLATGTIHRLWGAGFKVLVLECDAPAAIRRQVAVCEAVYEGKAVVEGMECLLVNDWQDAESVWEQGKVPLLVDATGSCLEAFKPDIVIDAIIAKKNLGTHKKMAPLVIALGPGFTAGEDVDCIVETKRGHNLGRIIRSGSAAPNSGVPGNIGGYTAERVLHAQVAGVIHVARGIGEIVEQGEVIAEIVVDGGRIPVTATIPGIIRGMIREGYQVTEGFKIADIDPRREELANCFTISDKARCIAGSVLELVCRYALENAKC